MAESDHEVEEVEVVPVRGSYFVVITTALIVVVMAVFTWVMYGMAQRVFVLTDVMVEMNGSFREIVANMDSMSGDMRAMNRELVSIGAAVSEMNGHMAEMNRSLVQVSEDMTYISGGVYYIGSAMSRMTYDVGKASSAFTSPLSYMFGNGFPF